MKRIIALILAAMMMTVVLAACGNNAQNTESTTAPADAGSTTAPADTGSSVNLAAVLNNVNSQFGLDGLKVLEDAKALNRYYQITEADVKQFAAELTTAASQYTEIVIVEAVDSTAAQNIKGCLDAHLDSQLNNAKSYDADQVAMIESCSTKTSGNFVYLVVSDQANEIITMIEGALK